MRKLLLAAMGFITTIAMNAQISVTTGGVSRDYRTFTDAVYAVNSANDTPVMKLKSNIIVDWDEEAPAITHSVDIDLNNHTLYSPMVSFLNVSNNNAVVTVMDNSAEAGGSIFYESEISGERENYGIYINQGTMVLKSGNIQSRHRSEACRSINVGTLGHFIMDGGTVSNSSTAYACAILVYAGEFVMNGGSIYSETSTTKMNNNSMALCCMNNCNVTVNGGSIEGRSSTVDAYAIYSFGGNVTLNDGLFTSRDNASGSCINFGASTLTVNGGKFVTMHNDARNYDFEGITVDKVRINGGYFSHEGGLERFIGARHIAILPADAPERQYGCTVFLSDEKPVVDVAKNLTTGRGYSTLEAALNDAVKGDTVSLQQDYTLGTDATVKPGVMLLIPFNIFNTCYTSRPECAYPSEAPHAFRTLTIADGVRLKVDGEMSVSATMGSSGGIEAAGCGSVFGNYGFVSLGKGAEISVGGSLYCNGYIAGEGKVVMEENSTLYENFQFTDWRGGNRSAELNDHMFVLQQYYVQNIEATLVMKPGARDIASSALFAINDNVLIHDISFIGNGDDALIIPGTATTITRSYDGTADRVRYVVDGDMQMGGLSLVVSDMSYKSNNVPCPLTSNMTIEMASGKMSMDKEYLMLPGADIVIGEKALLAVGAEGKLYMMDHDDWGRYSVNGYTVPLNYTIANGAENRLKRWGNLESGYNDFAWNALCDARLDVKGSAQVSGAIMCSDHGAQIVSSNGKGTVEFTNGISDTASSVYVNPDETYDLKAISMGAPQLTSADGTILNVQPTAVAATYICSNSTWTEHSIVTIDDITALIAQYLLVDTTVTIDDITALIAKYLAQ